MGAFHAMLTKLSWRPGATKLLIHIADAPCHGRQYHNGVSDSNPKGDPNGRTHEDMMKRMAEHNIQYFFGRINDTTEKMIGIFDQVLHIYSGGDLNIYTFNCADPDCRQFLDYIEELIKCSIKHSMAAASRRDLVPECRMLDKTFPDNFRGIRDRPGVLSRFIMPSSIECIDAGSGFRLDDYEAVIRVASKPFAKGSTRLAYHGYDLTHKKRIVLKTSKFMHPKFHSMKRYLEDMQVQAVAARFLSDFNKALPAPYRGRYDMRMIVSKVITFHEANNEREKYMSMESLLPPASYEKFTNN
eukprot:scpid99357/ scgid31253/ Alpha-protein kinase vwkA; von Willebrand factor A alpha-kinase